MVIKSGLRKALSDVDRLFSPCWAFAGRARGFCRSLQLPVLQARPDFYSSALQTADADLCQQKNRSLAGTARLLSFLSSGSGIKLIFPQVRPVACYSYLQLGRSDPVS